MRTTVYTSTATRDLTDDDLAELLRQCVRNNEESGLTGMLLHRDGRFMQVLEGPDDAVRDVFAVIAADTRHTEVRLLLDESISERAFPAWKMAFRTVDDATVARLEGYDDFLDRPAEAAARPDAPSRARWLLEWFRSHPV
ncbi:Blue light- and temperature-regulated antirepressor YcgF [Clavibacter michiganensis]|uniref:Blue light-and temperature-regulated antirepressor YcgF n=1 Tax=Clavibacter michiganensis TaxID=28447 RepID=A0A251Y3Y0_9MICO|nr:BLUF domain-containing protein [Clavibacter michiganensis]OUE18984.1 Blue light- and temperature-regulated antirepressor YcgF [Clavibacter michiganensis]